jgi:phytoene dehydrogenase-like protein
MVGLAGGKIELGRSVTIKREYDAVVVGSGPNGLAAAIVLAQAGKSVLVLEAQEQIGGGTRSQALTLPGFTHDVCSAVHPMAVASPFFRTLPLGEHGLEWIYPRYSLAHPLDDSTAVILERSLEQTAEALGGDANVYQCLVGSLAADWSLLEHDILSPVGFPQRPVEMARFGLRAVQPAARLARAHFKTEAARALFAGLAAHSTMPLDSWGTAAIGLVLGALAHVRGWPIAKGGSQRIADALASYLRSLGGEIVTGARVRSRKELPASRLTLCDVSPRGLLEIAGDDFPAAYRRALERYEYGPAVFKVDWALCGSIPWKAPECAKAGTVHIGGSFEEIVDAERGLLGKDVAERPFVLLSQPSMFDATRAPAGNHTAWAYCHVPSGSETDMAGRIEAQVERFAPGFRNLILARSTRSPAQMEQNNANLVGGNITGGANSLRQLFLRPTMNQYETPVKGLFLCSASTPPGGGVHGMCGYHAATKAQASI